MKCLIAIFCLTVLIAASPAHAEEVTVNTLTIEDVTPMLEDFVKQKPGQKLLNVFGISQAEKTNQAKIFFRYEKAGRGGAVPTRGEINCFKLNSGKWYCGGVYDLLKK